MASKYLQKFPVPDNFYEILHDFAREVIRDQPEDIIEYGSQYFDALQQGKPFIYEGKYNIKRADQKVHKEYHPENQRKFESQTSQEDSKQFTTVSQKKKPETEIVGKTPQPGQRPVSGGVAASKLPPGQRPQSHHGGTKKDDEIEGKPRVSSQEKRLDTETSHGTEKAAAHEYVSTLINRSLRSDQLEGEVEYPPENDAQDVSREEISGEFYVEILGAKNLQAEEAQTETFCVVLLSNNPTNIMKTGNSNDAVNPEWKHLDKFVVQINKDEIYDIQLVVQIFNFENGKTLIGESLMEALEIFASPGELKYVTLKLKNSEGAAGEFGDVSMLLSWVPTGENVPEFKEAFSYY